MNTCVGNRILFMIDQVQLMLVIVSFAVSLLFKDRKWSIFSGVIAAFYFIVWYLHCEIKMIDPNLQLRYLIWSGWTFLSCILIYKLFSNHLVYAEQAVPLIILSTVEIGLQIFRYVDRHYFGLEYSQLVYTSGIPTTNNMIAIVCFLPLFTFFSKGVLKWIRQ